MYMKLTYIYIYIGGMQVQSKGMTRSVVEMNGGEGKMKEMSN
jgi:hypothetical protein